MLEPRLATSIFIWLLAWRSAPMAESAIGVNWGTMSFRKLKPSTVLDLLKDNNIPKVKLFEAEADVLRALKGSGIQVMLGIPNEMLSLLSSSPSASDLWVRQNVSSYMGKGGVSIRPKNLDRIVLEHEAKKDMNSNKKKNSNLEKKIAELETGIDEMTCSTVAAIANTSSSKPQEALAFIKICFLVIIATFIILQKDRKNHS